MSCRVHTLYINNGLYIYFHTLYNICNAQQQIIIYIMTIYYLMHNVQYINIAQYILYSVQCTICNVEYRM